MSSVMTKGIGNENKEDIDRWLSFQKVLEVTSLGRSFIQGEINSGRLRSVKVGRCRRVRLSDLNEYMESFDGSGQKH